jgi:hypothetical protein
MKKALLASVVAAFMTLVAGATSAQVVDVVQVSANTQAWSTTVNPNDVYPYLGGVGPTTVSVVGDSSVSIDYISGVINPVLWGAGQASNILPDGYQGQTYGTGNSPRQLPGYGFASKVLPSNFIEPGNTGPDIYVGALIAAFADSNGKIVGTPFAPYAGWTSMASGATDANIAVPTGATELLLGTNNNALNATTPYSWTFDVTLTAQVGVGGGVPEAPTYLMALFGVLALGALGARRARA